MRPTSFAAARLAPELPPGYENTWRMMAERGIFSFDWDHAKDVYELVAVPLIPLAIAALPPQSLAAVVARRLAFPHLRFASLPTVTKELLLRLE